MNPSPAIQRIEQERFLRIAVCDFLRDHQREATRYEAAQRVNACAALLGMTAGAALAKFGSAA